MRVAIYNRISRDDHSDQGLGVARQQADCEALVARNGWQVAEVFTDNDISAYSGKPRPRYLAMLEAVKAGRVDVIVAWHPDRLHRSPKELEPFIDLVEASGVKVATVRAGELDLATATGRMTARVVGAVARHESEQKSERLRRKHQELAEAGKVSGGGDRAFGYEPDRVTVRAVEAAVIREAAERVLAGESIRSLTMWANREGHGPGPGREWAVNTFLRMLVSPRVAGFRQHNGEVFEAVWPAILDRVTWERVRRVLLDPGRRVNQGAHRYLLTGVLWCGRCGKRLHARPRSDKRRCVVCISGPGHGGCGKIRQLVEPLDLMVTEAMFVRADTPGVAEHAADAPRVDHLVVADEIAGLERELAVVGEELGAGRIDMRVAREASKALTARLEAAQAQWAEARPTAVTRWAGHGDDLRAAWPGMHIDQQRSIVADYIERIELVPLEKGRSTQVFWPGRVHVTWR